MLRLRRIDPTTAEPLSELHQECSTLLSELQVQLSGYADKVSVDPQRLRELDERLNLLHSLRGTDIAAGGDRFQGRPGRNGGLGQRDVELERINTRISGTVQCARWASPWHQTPEGHSASANLFETVGCARIQAERIDRYFGWLVFDGQPATGFDTIDFQSLPIRRTPTSFAQHSSSGQLAV
jgi:hypothetical protein